MVDPRSVVPESVMPGYPFLAERELDYDDIEERLRVNAIVGVPYTEEMIASARSDLERQAGADTEVLETFLARYPKAQARPFDGDASYVSELDALIAYMQMLGTLVDFATFDAAGPNLR
jgi:cytochrome c oxidase cbb3-type subunit 2